MIKKITICILLLCLYIPGIAQKNKYTSPKRELRSAWIATVWGIDWPNPRASASSQKAAMTRMLDSLKNNNFNAVNFQVRSMSDAMYKSSYEPWSSYLTGTRGKHPGYDPLQFVVSECHKRGMECHAWINPYRFCIGRTWSSAQDAEVIGGGHLLRSGKFYVLDPAQQWTVNRIVNVCKEIVTHYDIDGVLFDDYFYPDGIVSTALAGDYKEYSMSGSLESIGNWRRNNVMKMVKAVYTMLRQSKPWVRFGISPAGIACTQSWLAQKYGISPCPSGNDWQYEKIFSDPVAWLQAQVVDYVSPQIYWKTGNPKADYGLLAPWWCKTATHFGRQAFISAGIDKLSSTSEFVEWANQVQIARNNCQEGMAGIFFYSAGNLYRKQGLEEQLCHYLKRTVFTCPALPPIQPWRNKRVNRNLKVGEVTLRNGVLSWQPVYKVRYTVYMLPPGTQEANFKADAKHLLGIVYNPEDKTDDASFVLPADKRKGYRYAVCILDRYGNEYAPQFSQ